MEVNYTFRGIESTDTLKSKYVNNLSHVQKLFNGDVSLDVIFELEGNQRQVKTKLKRKNINTNFNTNTNNWDQSIKEITSKIDTFLSKEKDKYNSR